MGSPCPGALDLLVQAATANLEVPGLVELYTTLEAASLGAGDTVMLEAPPNC